MYFLIPFLKVDGDHKWVPPRLCESTQLALGIKKMTDILYVSINLYNLDIFIID